MSLKSKYFKTITTKNQNGYSYDIIRPVGSPMILFSEVDGSPLASVHLQCQTEEGRSLITKRPHKSKFPCDFQGLIDRDGQEFELVITNLCGEGMIKIDFMKTDTLVREVDPGSDKGGLNQVNELRSYDSYEVKCDQKDNRVLILNAIKKESGDTLTVKEAETKSDKPEGTYYYVTVVPQLGNPTLIEKFGKTKWACVDLFCLKTKEKHYNYRGGFMPASNNWTLSDNSRGEPSIEEGVMYRGFSACESADHFESMSSLSLSSNTKVKTESLPTSACVDEGSCEVLLIDPQHSIESSAAATVSGGRQIQVFTGVTGNDYSYDTPGEHCCLGLSISTELKFKEEPSDLEEKSKELLESYLREESKDLLAKLTKTYVSEECVICMDNTERVNTVFYACGHQCCHADCGKSLQKCPLCRNYITASLQV